MLCFIICIRLANSCFSCKQVSKYHTLAFVCVVVDVECCSCSTCSGGGGGGLVLVVVSSSCAGQVDAVSLKVKPVPHTGIPF